MINIIKGELSLVGPRSERPEFVTMLESTIPHYELRHIIRPGFTGWAQIKYKYTNTIDGDIELRTECMSKDFVKKLLLKLVDDAKVVE